jgi:prepilin-type N-terminal cleavage/methylation domain-containing protein
MLKNNKGLTLVELMIVIAVIGILGVVLVPQISGVKDKAREAGLEVNVKVVQGIVESMIENYGGSDAEASALAESLVAKLNTEDYQVRNPFSGNTKARLYGTDTDTSVKVYFNAGETYQSTDVLFADNSGIKEYLAGNIVVGITNYQNRIKVEIYKFDGKGGPITTEETKVLIK